MERVPLGKGTRPSAQWRRNRRASIKPIAESPQYHLDLDDPPVIAAVEASQSREIRVKTRALSGAVHVGVAGASLATRPAATQAEQRPGPRAMRAQ